MISLGKIWEYFRAEDGVLSVWSKTTNPFWEETIGYCLRSSYRCALGTRWLFHHFTESQPSIFVSESTLTFFFLISLFDFQSLSSIISLQTTYLPRICPYSSKLTASRQSCPKMPQTSLKWGFREIFLKMGY